MQKGAKWKEEGLKNGIRRLHGMLNLSHGEEILCSAANSLSIKRSVG